MTEQQRRFCELLIEQEGKNQYVAAIRAGYSEKSAHQQASNLMKNPEVMAYYGELRGRIAEQLREQFLFDATQARRVLRDILDKPTADDRDRIMAARDFLDRAGFAAVEESGQSAPVNVSIHYDYGSA